MAFRLLSISLSEILKWPDLSEQITLKMIAGATGNFCLVIAYQPGLFKI